MAVRRGRPVRGIGMENKAAKTVIPRDIDRGRIVFSLDIGTRTVVGVLGYRDEDEFVVLDCERRDHKINAMRDGQIEDIGLVSESVRAVKAAMEERCGIKFKKVAIAAAGRALRTVNETYSRELEPDEEITRSVSDSIEYSVVSKAQETFAKQKSKDAEEFFCVGYSITGRKLDGYAYSNLEGHRGKTAEVEVVAAFLPKHVIESLYAVTAKNGLEVDSLTLEPIAAINVIVPRDIRLLNIAIVDIGAGTSDIAVSRNGHISAYGMATIAGDEVSEAIMKRYLLGFEAAEKLKIDWAAGKEGLAAEDIFGRELSFSPEDVEQAARPVLKTLAEAVSKDILKVNGGAPVAVFLIGGGSMAPGLCDEFAAGLGLPPDRVAVGGRQPFKLIRLPDTGMISPEFVTPIGIGVVAASQRGCNFFSITVNGQKIMAVSGGITRIIDVILLAGIKPARLIGFSSAAVSYTVNGTPYTERGRPAEPGRVLLNGEAAAIQSAVKAGDSVEIVPAKDGETPAPTVREILETLPKYPFIFNGEVVSVRQTALVGGKKARLWYRVKNADAVETSAPGTVKELYECLDMRLPGSTDFCVNGKAAAGTSAVNPGDSVEALRRRRPGRPKKAQEIKEGA